MIAVDDACAYIGLRGIRGFCARGNLNHKRSARGDQPSRRHLTELSEELMLEKLTAHQRVKLEPLTIHIQP